MRVNIVRGGGQISEITTQGDLYVPHGSGVCCAWTNTRASALPSRDRWTSGFSSSSRRPACWWDSRVVRAAANNATCTLCRGRRPWGPEPGRIPAGSGLCVSSRRPRNRKTPSRPPASPKRGSRSVAAADPRVSWSTTEDRQVGCSVDRVTRTSTVKALIRKSTLSSSRDVDVCSTLSDDLRIRNDSKAPISIFFFFFCHPTTISLSLPQSRKNHFSRSFEIFDF